MMVAATALLFVGCAQELPTPQTDACNHHAAWVSEGAPVERAQRVARELSALMSDQPSTPVTIAVESLADAVVAGDVATVATASQSLAESCADARWEPPEG